MIINWRENAKMEGRDLLKTNTSMWERSEVIKSIPDETTRSVGYGFLTKEQRDWLLKQHSMYPITDTIDLTPDQIDLFAELCGVDKNAWEIPPDIVWNETVPIDGLRLTVSKPETDRYTESEQFISNSAIDIRIFRDIITEHIMKIHGELPPNQFEMEHGIETKDIIDEVIVVGSITMRTWKNNNAKTMETVTLPLIANKDKIGLNASYLGFSNNLKNLINDGAFLSKYDITPQKMIHEITSRAINMIKCWYGITLALLNPVLKEYFKNDTKIRDQVSELSSKNNKSKQPKKAKYIRRIVVNSDPIDDILFDKDKDGKVVRTKKLLWHVIGHWVHRGDKVFFRHGYWKGPLRYTKMMNQMSDEGAQEREVVINKDMIE